MRRVIVAAWGPEATAYAGRRLTLYREPSIMFGGRRWAASASRTCRTSPKRVEVWPGHSWQAREVHCRPPPRRHAHPHHTPEPTAAQVDACTDIAVLDRMWQASGAERRAQIEARKVDLPNEPGAGA